MARIKLENISKDFGKTAAVHNFTVTVADGEFITFLGPSGCGKTTSLRLVAGFIEPTGGAVIIGDRPVSDPGRGIFVPPEDRKVGMVFQSYAVWPHMKVFDNVAYPLKIKRVPRKEIARRVEETLALVKMPELLDRYPHELSGGQQQRVALARALVMTPEVLLLDEPLSNLYAKLREEMRIELKELQKNTGVTIIFVTHDQLEAMVMSDRVVVMERGEIHQIGTPEEIYRHPTDKFVADFIGSANFIRVERRGEGVVLSGLADEGPVVVGVSTPDADVPSQAAPGPTAGRAGVFLPLKPPAGLPPGELILMVRPEEIELSREKGDLRAIISQKMFIGDAVLYILALERQALRAKTEATVSFAPGEEVFLSLSSGYFLT